MKKLSIGFTTCSNDVFIMYAIMQKKIDLRDYEFEVNILEIEKLNLIALEEKLDIVKTSAVFFKHVNKNYFLLDSGSAFGIDGGPLLISRPKITLNENSTICIPGKYTSAHALFNRFWKKPCRKLFVSGSEIFDLLSSQQIDAGVVIHEHRFTFSQHGFVCISDLGLEWTKETKFPVPLGIFLVKKNLGIETLNELNTIFVASIEYARNNYDEVFQFIKSHSQNIHPDAIKKHIDFYVNDYTISLGETGLQALYLLNNE